MAVVTVFVAAVYLVLMSSCPRVKLRSTSVVLAESSLMAEDCRQDASLTAVAVGCRRSTVTHSSPERRQLEHLGCRSSQRTLRLRQGVHAHDSRLRFGAGEPDMTCDKTVGLGHVGSVGGRQTTRHVSIVSMLQVGLVAPTRFRNHIRGIFTGPIQLPNSSTPPISPQ